MNRKPRIRHAGTLPPKWRRPPRESDIKQTRAEKAVIFGGLMILATSLVFLIVMVVRMWRFS